MTWWRWTLARAAGMAGIAGMAVVAAVAAPAVPVAPAVPAAPAANASPAANPATPATPEKPASPAAPENPANAGAAFDEGEKALAAGDLPAALERMEAAVAADPENLRYASEYRQAVIRAGAYDRALERFAKLVADHPDSAFAWLNYGYVYVDKMPAAGAITQVILANDALQKFSRSIELKASWLALYTRGNSYLYWPKIFGRGPLAVADLERAVAISKTEPKRRHHVHAWAALGDAYWRTDQPERARATWDGAARLFPQDAGLKARLSRQGDELEAYIADQLDRTKRVNTDLREIWEGQ
ncbi:MAG: tetratricopeptide repeat protein [Acidobacteria bacterium]|nr:tetratricopeptide repeat protein [Acidobacteriota bacterium]